ncbi:MAG: peroxiredoxin family protein [Sandaracinaceae bacterium]
MIRERVIRERTVDVEEPVGKPRRAKASKAIAREAAPEPRPARRSRSRGTSGRPELVALIITAAIALPLAYAGTVAFVDGEERRGMTPIRALMGAASYDAWASGETYPQNYFGDDRSAPDFTLPTADGGTWRLSDHRGKVIVLNFWTVTCQPCVEEMPNLISLAQMLDERGDDIELVTISTDGDWDTVHTVVPADAPMTVLLDPEREVVRGRFGTRLYPETWVIDPDGIIRLRIDGAREWDTALAIDVFETFLD